MGSPPSTGSAWLEAMEPPCPAVLARELRVDLSGDAPVETRISALTAAAVAALEAAVAGEPPRGGAFRLLEADALVTYACEQAMNSEEPEKSLMALIETLVGEATRG